MTRSNSRCDAEGGSSRAGLDEISFAPPLLVLLVVLLLLLLLFLFLLRVASGAPGGALALHAAAEAAAVAAKAAIAPTRRRIDHRCCCCPIPPGNKREYSGDWLLLLWEPKGCKPSALGCCNRSALSSTCACSQRLTNKHKNGDADWHLELQRAGRASDMHGLAAAAKVLQGQRLPCALQQLHQSGTGTLEDGGCG